MQTCFVPGEVVGTLIGAFELTDPTDCLVKCEASDGCTWFTHHTREQFCALYSEMQEINVQRCPSCVSGKNGSFHIVQGLSHNTYILQVRPAAQRVSAT